MDPNACLEEMRDLVRSMLSREQGALLALDVEQGGELAEKFQALDEWIHRQGFLPRDWTPRP